MITGYSTLHLWNDRQGHPSTVCIRSRDAYTAAIRIAERIIHSTRTQLLRSTTCQRLWFEVETHHQTGGESWGVRRGGRHGKGDCQIRRNSQKQTSVTPEFVLQTEVLFVYGPLVVLSHVDVVRMQHLPRKIKVADLLTKAVARVLFASLMDLIRQYAESGVACPSM